MCAFVLAASGTRAEAPQEKPSYRVLYLVRHGEYVLENENDPQDGGSLVPLGVAQARLVASRLRAMPEDMTALYSSTVSRAKQTAAVIQEQLDHLEVQEMTALAECTPPTWREDVMKETNAEEAAACRARLEEAFATLFVPSRDGAPRHDVVVCHGNVIRYFVTKVLGVDTEAWLGMFIANCGLTVVRVQADGSMRLVSYNDVGHLPEGFRTGMGEPDGPLVVPAKGGTSVSSP
jgi:serine/threonine-protein phosphatase PGAM5